jgi:hypothetical protein
VTTIHSARQQQPKSGSLGCSLHYCATDLHVLQSARVQYGTGQSPRAARVPSVLEKCAPRGQHSTVVLRRSFMHLSSFIIAPA